MGALAVAWMLANGAIASAAAGERVPVAVLVLDGNAELSDAVDKALGAARDVRPLDDAGARKLLVEGGAASQAAALLAKGKERFAALRGDEADAALASAEQVALRDLPVAQACPRLAAIESLRLKYAELIHDEAAAGRAALLLAACVPQPNPDDGAAIARHPPARLALLPPPPIDVRIESEPPGATVYVDLRPVGKTPCVLPAERRADALVDVELAGYRKVHRAGTAAGTLALGLSPDDGLTALVDRTRLVGGDPPEAGLAEVGRRVGAARVLVLRTLPGEPAQVQARLFDVASGKWSQPTTTVPVVAGAEAGATATRLAAYAAQAQSGIRLTLGTSKDKSFGAPLSTSRDGLANKPSDKTPAWKRWYTWVIGGALLAGVATVLIVDHVGSDQVTVHVTR